MALYLTNTLTRRKELFVPRDEGKVGIYLCGPTVYSEPHIGNLRNVVVLDVLRRHLVASGYKVLFVRNYTDVDDHVVEASGHDALRAFVVAEHWTRVYEAITAALGILPPDIAPRATGHIPEMIELVAKLFDNGLAYQAGPDVYFAVGKFPEYGKLSGRDTTELMAGARVEVNPDKRDPLDFVLWKGAKPGEPSWKSPWGPGRPGWHLECSAMSSKYLGPCFDIHGGGEDLVFPHHENEIAQYEGATGEPFARYWLHNAFLELRGEKMAKSVGNVVSPRQLLERYRGVVLRYALMSAHYRSPLEFSPEVLADAAAAYQRLSTFAVNAARALPPGGEAPRGDEGHWAERFVAALDDDINVPAALAVLFDLVNAANPAVAKAERGSAAAIAELRTRLATFSDLAARLGFTPLLDLPDVTTFPAVLDLVLELRERTRAARDFAAADMVRERLGAIGIRVEDRPGGPRWHLAR
ncbi:MAG TPA: cysteine--tRNA ligase [Actinomycetes bacterium]|nr:cysteine--tRNA ligase [Actinomycetes bacterium]